MTTSADVTPAASAGTEAGADLTALALKGLTACAHRRGGLMPFTLRGVPGDSGPRLRTEGTSLRYTAIAALGLSRAGDEQQRKVLDGSLARDVAVDCLGLARRGSDAGAWALSLWAAGEVAGVTDEDLIARLLSALSGPSVATLDAAWALTAALSVAESDASRTLVEVASRWLLASRGAHGIYPHVLPMPGTVRGHVGSFADQVYPLQALARLARRRGSAAALQASSHTADRLVELQGSAGQWWWHYDARTGGVVERFPVYSVHQHGMAPMALTDLARAGGPDHAEAVGRGHRWLLVHPESMAPLVDADLGVVWRKVGRFEPRKAARGVQALVTRIRPRSSVPGLDVVWPPGRVDYECRPYELGWLLYAAPGDLTRREGT